MPKVKRVAVLGAGVMGTGIACHLANAGIPSLLFDVVPDGTNDGARSRLAAEAIVRATKTKPAPLYVASCASLITPCNYHDDAGRLKDCDWVIEVVVERLDIKQKVFAWIAEHASRDALVSSNTSGITLQAMTQDMPAHLRARFVITHFFNPVRYMRLVEIVGGPHTNPDVLARAHHVCDRLLGKGVVTAKDTPNFIANRIGTFSMARVFAAMRKHHLTYEQVDAVFGTPMARAKSAVFRTADLVGLDTLVHVLEHLHASLPDDPRREVFRVPPDVTALVASGALGAKAGRGFYKKEKGADGTTIRVYDPKTGDYRPKASVRFSSVGAARKKERPGDRIKALIEGDDAAAHLAWEVLADTLIYAAECIPGISDDIVNVDRAMRWGFGWELGPFETWDAIGVALSVERMKADERAVPPWVEAMLESGRTTFYARHDDGSHTQHAPTGASVVPAPPGTLRLTDRVAGGHVVERTVSGSLIDLGDGCLGFQLHAKMNALDDVNIGLFSRALDKLDADEFDALVIGNQDPKAFCAGANVLMILMHAMQGDWDTMDAQLTTLQQLMMRAKHHTKPVVSAPFGFTFGGGCELAMHSASSVATGELYMGLVEVGVGLIPAAGGCKELLFRALATIPSGVVLDPSPFVHAAFERIATAKVSTSAAEARAWSYLRPTDHVTMNPDRQLFDAKRWALGLAAGGYRSPPSSTIRLPGPSGRAAIDAHIAQLHAGGFATDHDAVVAKRLAHVMTGGDAPASAEHTEQSLLDLEREAFLSLAGTEASQARMQHMLQTGKPLRN